MIFFLIFIFVIFLLFALVVIDTIRRKGRFGLNFQTPNCPNCGQKAPFIRIPRSSQQALWGGWTCSKCGCEIDKWGKAILPNSKTEIDQLKIGAAKESFIPPFDEQGKSPVERILEEKSNKL